jgi:hypothetical protein
LRDQRFQVSILAVGDPQQMPIGAWQMPEYSVAEEPEEVLLTILETPPQGGQRFGCGWTPTQLMDGTGEEASADPGLLQDWLHASVAALNGRR